MLNSGWSGIDLSQQDLDAPMDPISTDAIQTTVSSLSGAADAGGRWTLRDSARLNATGGSVVVGSGETVADALEHFMTQTDVDGFNLAYALNPGTWEDVIEHLVPVLQDRGLYPRAPESGTLRDRMFGRGDRLPAEHRGAAFCRR